MTKNDYFYLKRPNIILNTTYFSHGVKISFFFYPKMGSFMVTKGEIWGQEGVFEAMLFMFEGKKKGLRPKFGVLGQQIGV